MVAIRQRPALAISLVGLLTLTAGCGRDAVEEVEQPPDCPTLTDEQLAQFIRLQSEGIEQYQKREAGESVKTLEQAVAINPCDASVHNDLGISYHQNHEIKKAIETLERAIELDPLYPISHLNLGIVYDDFANFPEAAKAYRAFLDINPDFHDARSRLGLVYLKMNKYPEARVELERAAELKPEDWEVWYNLGNIAFKDKDYDTAEKHYRTTLEANPNYTEAHYKLGQTLQRLDRNDEAQAYFKEFKELAEHQEKIDELNRLLRQNTDRADAVHMLLGMQYTQIGRHSEAVKNFKKSIEINPETPEAYIGLATAYRNMKNYEDAIQMALKARDLAPDMIQVYDQLMASYNDQGEYEKAIEIVKTVQEKRPEYKEAKLNIGVLRYRQHSCDKAIPLLDEYLTEVPDSLLAHEVLLDIYSSPCGSDRSYMDDDKALDHAKMAERLGSRRYELVAEGYHKAGDYDRASEWLERAIAEATEEHEVASLREHLDIVESQRSH